MNKSTKEKQHTTFKAKIYYSEDPMDLTYLQYILFLTVEGTFSSSLCGKLSILDHILYNRKTQKIKNSILTYFF